MKKEKNIKQSDILNILANNSLIVLLSELCSIVGLVISVLNDGFVLKIISLILIVLASVAIIIIAIYKTFSYNKLKKKANESFDSKIRSIFESIEEQNHLYKQCFDNIQNGMIVSYDNLDYLLKPLVDCIVDLTRCIVNEKSCVCIKIIDTDSLMNENIDSWKIRTIARSKSTKPNRKKKDNQSILISQNSDFKTIIDGENPKYSDCFIAPNLEKLAEIWKESGLDYLNSTPDYLERYKSTIVFPIRTEIDRVSSRIKDHISWSDASRVKYHVVGFLCWDSKSVFSEDDVSFSLLAEILGSFSETLYPLLENYLVYQLQDIIKN